MPESSRRWRTPFNEYDGKPARRFTPELVLRDGFPPDPAFSVLLVEMADEVVGYAMVHAGGNSDRAARELCLVDLFVVETARGRGAGRALLAAVAAEALRRGAQPLIWGVRSANLEARAFYETVGARDEDARILAPDGPGFSALAAEGRTYLRGLSSG